MKAARILILGVALAAGGVAAYLVTSDEPPPAPPPQVAAAPTDEVLVASSDIGIGQAVSAQTLRWQAWPSTATASPNFILKKQRPNGMEQLIGSIARTPFANGEPIREDKLIKGNGGYLAAVLPQGMRAISTPISPETGAGGFILPNDRVDVVLIRAQKTTTGGEIYTSETILTNVRVLAIDQTVEEKNGQRVVVGKIATLALNARNAETLVLATRLGTMALALRSMADGKGADVEEAESPGLARAGISIVRYGLSSTNMR
jgi:pilus assembly protein CpaB